MGFAQGFMQGFGLMDAYYTRKDEREYRKERREMERESHDANMARIKQQGELTDLQIGEYKDQNFANEYASIVTNDDGSPIDLSKLTPEQLHQKKGQFTGFLNRFEPAKRFFTENKDVDPENPLAGVDIIYDKKSKQPSMVFNLRMKDGRTATLSERRSSDADDPYVVVPLTEVDAQIRGALGTKMGMKATPQEYRANKAATAAEDRKYSQQLGLESVKHRNAMRLEAFKEGYSFDEKGNPVAPGRAGGLHGKKLDDEVKRMDALLKTQYGSQDITGMTTLDGTGQQLSWAGILGRQMLESGQAPNAHEAVARAMQIADGLKAAGGEIVWDNDTGQFLMFDGTTNEQGQPNVAPLMGRPAPAAAPAGGGEKQADSKPPTAAAPSRDEYVAKALEVAKARNIPADQARRQAEARYSERYGGKQGTDSESQRPAEKPSSSAGLDTVDETAPAEKPKAKPRAAERDPKAHPTRKTAGMGAGLTLADVEAMRGNGGRTPQQNLDKVKGLLDAGRDEFGRELTKESRQRLVDEFNRLYSQIANPNAGISFRRP